MTSFEKLQRRIGGFPIEYPAAALMAGAVALCTLALPEWRFESAVNATGLPAIVSAAAPPLGTTARVLAALGLGVLSFLAVWFALRALDAKPQSSDFPAFRAADLHPDAPRRRPILAGAEFGAPATDLPSIEDQLGRRRAPITEPLPSFLAPQASEPEARRPSAMRDAVEKPAAAEPVAVRPAPAPVPAPAPAPAPVVEQKDVPAETVAPRPPARPAEEQERVEAAQPVPAAAAPAAPAAPKPAAPVPAAVLPGDHDEEEESVSELMVRLESGLSRSGSRPVPGPSGNAQDELRRALGDLNRVSGRG